MNNGLEFKVSHHSKCKLRNSNLKFTPIITSLSCVCYYKCHIYHLAPNSMVEVVHCKKVTTIIPSFHCVCCLYVTHIGSPGSPQRARSRPLPRGWEYLRARWFEQAWTHCSRCMQPPGKVRRWENITNLGLFFFKQQRRQLKGKEKMGKKQACYSLPLK